MALSALEFGARCGFVGAFGIVQKLERESSLKGVQQSAKIVDLNRSVMICDLCLLEKHGFKSEPFNSIWCWAQA